MRKGAYAAFGVITYLIFFATFLYLIGFTAGVAVLPRTVDHGPAASTGAAFIIDVGLLALFGLQHSGMARRSFKAATASFVPAPVERSVYVLVTSAVLVVMFALWRPLATILWHVGNPIGAALLWGLCGVGWALVLLSTFLINHFELFGLRQVYAHWRSAPPSAMRLRQPWLYGLVRHPLYSGFMIALWATPVMTAGHLLFAAGLSAYILIGIRYEERDLVAQFGPDYEDYRRRVGMLTPRRAKAV